MVKFASTKINPLVSAKINLLKVLFTKNNQEENANTFEKFTRTSFKLKFSRRQ